MNRYCRPDKSQVRIVGPMVDHRMQQEIEMAVLKRKSKLEPLLIITLAVFLLSSCGTAPPTQSGAVAVPGDLVEIDTRPGVSVKCLIVAPARPLAAVLFLKGGKGLFGLRSGGDNTTAEQGQVIIDGLARHMTSQGIVVGAVDAPSDKPNGFDFTFRTSEDHTSDLEAVIGYVRTHYEVPVWLFGHGAGTLSAAGLGVNFPDGIDGLVLAAPATKMVPDWGSTSATHPDGILDMDLDWIAVPVLIVYHREDQCAGTPPADIPRLAAAIEGSDTVEIEEGNGYEGDPCGPLSAHSFHGVEKDVYIAVAAYILSRH